MRSACNYMEEMTEVIIDAANRSKRRLPMWMQSNDTPKNENCGNLDEISSTSESQNETPVVISRIESMSKKIIRKPKRGGGSKNSTDNFIRSKRKVKDDIIGMTNDEAELAVEDLLSIAEEFLSADKVMQHEQSVTRKSDCSASNSFPVTPSLTHDEKLNGAIIVQQSLSKCNQTGKSASFSPNRVIQCGDVAQDMLELFLGPLLKKAPPKESDPEIIPELLTANYDSYGEVTSSADEERARLMKKKRRF